MEQEHNITDLHNAEFLLFCQTEDLLMAKKIIDRMNQLKNDEDNYNELRQTEEKFNSRIDNFLIDKAKNLKIHQEELEVIIKHLKDVSRFKH